MVSSLRAASYPQLEQMSHARNADALPGPNRVSLQSRKFRQYLHSPVVVIDCAEMPEALEFNKAKQPCSF